VAGRAECGNPDFQSADLNTLVNQQRRVINHVAQLRVFQRLVVVAGNDQLEVMRQLPEPVIEVAKLRTLLAEEKEIARVNEDVARRKVEVAVKLMRSRSTVHLSRQANRTINPEI